jgi:uncharacterized protein YheU (UPF0270 family)
VSDDYCVPALALDTVVSVLVVREGLRNGEIDDSEKERRERVHESFIYKEKVARQYVRD